jgi:hypothetical protein
MRLTRAEHIENARDWIGASWDLEPVEKIDRTQLAEQFTHTIADAEDIEAIAEIIEKILEDL